MRLDEFTLAGEQPSPVQTVGQQVQPVPQQAPQQSGGSFGEHIKNLVAKEQSLPADDPVKNIISRFLSNVEQFLSLADASEEEIQEAVTRAKAGKQVYQTSGAASNVSFIRNANKAYLDGALATMLQKHPELEQYIRTLQETASEMDFQTEVSARPEVKKATTAAIKGIQLNTKGEIGKMDKDIEDLAQQFAKDFGVKLIWARNLVGMFGMNISREDRHQFLVACRAGTALDINKMISMREGSIEDCVTTNPPSIKDVFAKVKETLLDISLSTGQRGATGPFEAMLAIMGGAVKPDTNEGGDVKFSKLPGQPKYEVKSTSISAGSDGTGSNTTAWLDSTSGKEVGGSRLRQVADEWINKNAPGALTNQEFKKLWTSSDFRAKTIGNLKEALVVLRDYSKVRGPGLQLIKYMMAEMFPATAKNPEFDFNGSCTKILNAIGKGDTATVATEQGVMALLEYVLGKGNDGFIFFNSSTQKFLIINGVDGIYEEAQKPNSNLHFDYPMTMGSSAKASPGIYYGATYNSEEGQAYLQMYNSSPERVALLKKAEEKRLKDKEDKLIAAHEAAMEGNDTYVWGEKTLPIPKLILKQYR